MIRINSKFRSANSHKSIFSSILLRNFNLYFIDFLIWKLYKTDEIESISEEIKKLKEKINDLKNLFSQFKFKALNSKEHLFPQSKAKDFDIVDDDLNSIGNLCLISSSQNSSGNNDLPVAKKKSFATDISSLKRLIMFNSFTNEVWGSNEIKKHELEINSLIDFYLK